MGKAIPTLTLNNGVKLPALGFGTYSNEVVKGETHDAVITALDAGYRHIDCAWFYQNEDEVGSALREWLSKNPSVEREDIFITTKVWQHLAEPEDVEWSLNDSLRNLGLDYIDAFLIHWPFAVERTEDHQVKLDPNGKYILKKSLTDNLQPTWRAMEKAFRAGKARSIGVSNWNIPQLEHLLKYADIPPAINQVEIHPFFPNTQLINFCTSHSILPVAYSPLAKMSSLSIATNAGFLALAEKKSATVAQILIAWGIKRAYAVIPKSANAARVKSNFELVELSDEEFEAVNKVTEGKHERFVNPKDIFGFDPFPGEESK
ncbi:Glycerol 2-dehydrogenase (NADP(+)) [Lachnellula occidentalis]|uniref:Glycerol 2-dehydrogenase (NADP(+)) n=1 Tax=Lachnellula occidentalis TaxID=215460 RepID=A0A8H8UKI1_9HELO|nr:Glycerol 2-dehydrogenase (NADP(+)) [Lachnellula occidentalis]